MRNENYYKNLINELEKKQSKIEGHKILCLSIEEYDDLNAEIDILIYHIFIVDSDDNLSKEISELKKLNPEIDYYEVIEPRITGDKFSQPLH